MSKENPEVGDVWLDENSGSKIVFVCVNDYYMEYLEHNTKLAESFDVYRIHDTKSTLWKDELKYLGKSKANVEELFDVQNT